MTLEFFLNHYNFEEFNIHKATLNNYILKIYVTINTHLDLIANGYRPELDLDYDVIFSFNVSKEKDDLYDFDEFDCYKINEKYFIKLKNIEFEIISDEIKIEKMA